MFVVTVTAKLGNFLHLNQSELTDETYCLRRACVQTWFRYFPAKNVWYLSLLRMMGKARDSGPFCHWGLEQFPDRELFLTPWLWGYCPVRMLLLLGQHSGVTVNFRKEPRMAIEEDNRGRGGGIWAKQKNMARMVQSQLFWWLVYFIWNNKEKRLSLTFFRSEFQPAVL